MKVKFLGTSSGWPYPRLGCHCAICSSGDRKDKRQRPSLLLESRILIDAGPDLYRQLLKESPENLEAVVITHAHPDHTLGIYDLSHIYNLRRKRLKLYALKETANSIKKIFITAKFNFNYLEEGETENLGKIEITPFLAPHSKRVPTLGLKVNGKSLIYIPDLAALTSKLKEKCKKANLLILDGSKLKISRITAHTSIEEEIAFAQNCGANTTYFTHIGHSTLPHKELENYVRENGGENFHIAYDNLELTI